MPEPETGLEVKAWFPLATEITARFRDSQALLQNYNTRVVVYMLDARVRYSRSTESS